VGSRSVYGRVTTLESVLTAVAVAAFGGVLIWVSSLKVLDHHGTWRLLLDEFGTVLIAAVALGVLWELVGKRAFASEMFAVAGVGVDVLSAGIVRVGTSYLDDVAWQELFKSAEKLDVFVAYASTWRSAHYHRLQELAGKPQSRVRVYLPDPYDEGLVTRLALRFSMTVDQVRERIRDARAEFAGFQRENGGTVSVFYHSGDPVFSCYRFDGTIVLTLYSHTRARQKVPTIVCRQGGELYEFVRDELTAIDKQSKPADDVDAEHARKAEGGSANERNAEQGGHDSQDVR
jgi:hypothetical protein